MIMVMNLRRAFDYRTPRARFRRNAHNITRTFEMQVDNKNNNIASDLDR